MHRAGFAATGRRGAYVACDVPPERLGDAVRGLLALGFSGANVTVPHKVAVMHLADRLDASAVAAGAVNVLAVADGRLEGFNTDGPGFLRSLEEAGWDPAGRRAVLLGAGGAARAVAAALLQAGAQRVTVANRTPERGAELVGRLGAAAPGRLEACAWDSTELLERLRSADLVVNCTSVGMHPREGETPLADLAPLPSTCLVADLVYNPPETALLRAARRRGLATHGGVGMLAWQAALAWEIWFGEVGPVAVFADAAQAALAGSPAGPPTGDGPWR
jgi:shikimate dehydrogenase